MIDYDSFSRCHLTIHAGAKELSKCKKADDLTAAETLVSLFISSIKFIKLL